MIESDPGNPAVPTSAPRRWDWKHGARWFGAEFLVVVTGVLVALTLNAWWGSRLDTEREHAYIRQLRTELNVSVTQLRRELQIQRDSERAAVQLQRAALLAVRPPEDSLVTWAIDVNYYSDPSPNLGTARALITTGDLLLLQDPDLRSAVVDVVESAAYTEAQLNIWQPFFLNAIDRLDGVLSNTQLIAAYGFTPRLDTLTASRDWLPALPERRASRAPDVSALLDDPEFQNILRAVRLSSANLRSFQEDQFEEVRTALSIVEQASGR